MLTPFSLSGWAVGWWWSAEEWFNHECSGFRRFAGAAIGYRSRGRCQLQCDLHVMLRRRFRREFEQTFNELFGSKEMWHVRTNLCSALACSGSDGSCVSVGKMQRGTDAQAVLGTAANTATNETNLNPCRERRRLAGDKSLPAARTADTFANWIAMVVLNAAVVTRLEFMPQRSVPQSVSNKNGFANGRVLPAPQQLWTKQFNFLQL